SAPMGRPTDDGPEGGAAMSKRVPRSVLTRLRKMPLFSACTKRELRALAVLGTPVPIGAGQKITVAGEPGLEWFVVLSGRANCTVLDREVATFGPGDFFGELSLIDGRTRTASVIAQTPMQLLDFDRNEFGRVLEVAPSVVRKILTTVVCRLREADIVIGRCAEVALR
ncbi:MAG: cyclic nucleotide-binding domain-containing protein, partial [Blastocatellia bacterium]